MLDAARKALLCERGAPDLTGVDFVTVVDPATQDRLRVYFVVDPRVVNDPAAPGATLADPAAPFPQPASAALASIAPAPGHDGAAAVTVTAAQWVLDIAADRVALEVAVAAPGDFSTYALTVQSDAMDRFFASTLFSFKQGCESPFDCAPRHVCPEQDAPDVEVDYLARDFESYRRALLDFAARRYPDWAERTPADAAAMLSEAMAALADEMAFLQDRLWAQGFLETATHPRALTHLARLVDYERDQGATATTLLALSIVENGAVGNGVNFDFADRIPVWAAPDAGAALPFELGAGLDDDGALWAHSHWNAMALHQPDPSKPCLPVGATEAFLGPVTLSDGSVFNASPLTGALPPGSPLSPEAFWVGRRMVLRASPPEPEAPTRVHVVTVVEAEILSDPLAADPGDPPVVVTRLRWETAEALPFEIPIDDAVVLGNIAEASAGRTLEARFRVGDDDAVAPDLRAVPRAVEREGPLDATTGWRGPVMLFGLVDSAKFGLAWRGGTAPDIRLDQVDAFDPPDPTPTPWAWTRSLVDGDGQARLFTLDPGLIAPILRFEREGETFVFADHAGGDGFTLRFGDGRFGRRPEPGDLFRVRFRTNPGVGANAPADVVRHLANPADAAATPHPALGLVAAVTNPAPARGARAAESAARTRIRAPELYKRNPLRAVVNEDYRDILGRIDWVQNAAAQARHTGTWLTRFATADPLDAIGLSDDRFAQLVDTVECIRQAGREVRVSQPKYAAIDLMIALCLEEGVIPGVARKDVLAALSDARGGFFDPDNWSFGDPLRRSALEATVQCAPGVVGVRRIEYRRRGATGWRLFTGDRIDVAPTEIIQLRNDPRFPGQGSIRIRFDDVDEGAAP